MTRYVRNSHKIHQPTCRYAVACAPWNWAEDKNDDEWLKMPWLKPCKACLPDLVTRQRFIIGDPTGIQGDV